MSKNTHEIDAYVRTVNQERTVVETMPLSPGSAVTQNQIRVGIIGANAKRGWAKVSHIPAINGIPGLKLAAVATRNEESARLAAESFGADRWYSDPLAMIRDERIDLITISVKVPAHRELVLAALEAGKAVYCEAPLGRSVAEAEEMAGAAGPLHTAIGLQGRFNPAVRRAAELVSSESIGPHSTQALSPPSSALGRSCVRAMTFTTRHLLARTQ